MEGVRLLTSKRSLQVQRSAPRLTARSNVRPAGGIPTGSHAASHLRRWLWRQRLRVTPDLAAKPLRSTTTRPPATECAGAVRFTAGAHLGVAIGPSDVARSRSAGH